MADGPNADFFAPAVEATPELVVPTVCIYEVFKRVSQQRDETDALRAVALMMQGRLITLDADLSLRAAKLSLALRLPMADSIILTTARSVRALLWTRDRDFRGLEGVEYVEAVKG